VKDWPTKHFFFVEKEAKIGVPLKEVPVENCRFFK
jgi:hypothetical protein